MFHNSDMDAIDRAFSAVPRRNFVPDSAAYMARVDAPVPIGFGQTNSQPTTVQRMLEWLEVEPGNKILDVGSGSGWTAALLSNLTGPQGRVYGVELIPELVEFGTQNLKRQAIKNARIYHAGKKFGLPRFAPYDRILVSASAEELPEELLHQLKRGGKMVIPVGNDILEIEKVSDDKFNVTTNHGYVFVPLVRPEN